jgi:hypothetical protein
VLIDSPPTLNKGYLVRHGTKYCGARLFWI